MTTRYRPLPVCGLQAAVGCGHLGLGCLGRRDKGQSEAECGAVAEFAFRPDAAAVSQHDVLDDGQAEPCAARLAGASLVDAVKTLENAR